MAALDLKVAIYDQSSFLLDFYSLLDRQGNAVVSPLSISLAIAMAAAGAKGQTLEQVTSVLKLPSGTQMHESSRQLHSVLLTNAGGPVLSIANGLWLQQELKLHPRFEKIVREQYGAEAKLVDFKKAEESRDTVNAWVSDKTRGKIQELLEPGMIKDLTKLLLVNALYFKGAWLKPFEKASTQEGTFLLSNGKEVKVPMMKNKPGRKLCIKNQDKFKILKLAYESGRDLRRFSMYILLPNDRDGLEDMVKSIVGSQELLGQSLVGIPEVAVGNFMLPRFKATKSVDAAKLLQKMGLVLPFSLEKADFSGMLESADVSDKLFISDVVHKAFVEVNEEGTEAAAATAVVATFGSRLVSTREDFVADHPFMFLIREDLTGVILFVGHVNDPSI